MNHLPDGSRTGLKTIEVALIALVRTGPAGWEVLLTKRPDEAHLGGYWELPGGKVELDDGDRASPEAHRRAAAREAEEELAITIDPHRLEPAGETAHAYTDRVIRFHLFVCRCDAEQVRAVDQISRLNAWVLIDQLGRWNLPPANAAINQLIIARLEHAGEANMELGQ